MKKALILASGVALAAGAAVPAFATSTGATGTVDVNGTVTAQCSATNFSDTITLGELEDATSGALDTALPNNTGLKKSFKVVCNSGAPTVEVSATQLSDGVTPASGYTSTIDYTATATAHLANSTTTDVVYNTTSGTPGNTSTPLGGPLANPALGDNLDVTLSSAHTATATDILTAGSYTSAITVTVTPT